MMSQLSDGGVGLALGVATATAVGATLGYFLAIKQGNKEGKQGSNPHVQAKVEAGFYNAGNSKLHGSQNPIHQYISEHSLRLIPAQKGLIEATSKVTWSMMLSSADELQFLQNLARVIKAKKTLDVGVYTGYSALTIALALPEDGTVVACDVSEEYTNVGKPFWKEAGVDHKIDLRIAPALQTLEGLLANGEAGTYDFAFIDADKTNYDNYYEMCLKLVRSGGIIAVDNVLWSNSVIDQSKQDKTTQAIRAINDKLAKDERVYISMLQTGDGTTLLFKK